MSNRARAEYFAIMDTVTFSYKLDGAGWATATLSNGRSELNVTISYLTDALGDLTATIVGLLENARYARFSWEDEPGEYRWIIKKGVDGKTLHLKILGFGDVYDYREDEKGQVLFETECQLLQFAVQVKTALKTILQEHGVKGYKDMWVLNDFPLSEYKKLEKSIRQWQTRG